MKKRQSNAKILASPLQHYNDDGFRELEISYNGYYIQKLKKEFRQTDNSNFVLKTIIMEHNLNL